MKPSRLNMLVVSLLLAACSSTPPQAATPAQPPQAPAKPIQTGSPPATPEKSTLAATGRDPAEFPGYIDQLKQQARAAGLSSTAIANGFTGVHFVDHVVTSDRNQPEKKLTLDDYLTRVLTPTTIAKGQENFQHYQNQLQPVAARYGVAAQYLVALWGMESRYGALQGKEEVVSALATLAFEGRREKFFTSELFAALKIIDQQQMAAAELKGSWAGAMGQSQFMPSSFLNFGADGDGDGKIDIWNNVDDVFASAANYLARNGWHAGEGWGQQVTLPDGFNRGLAGTGNNQSRTVAQWQAAGIQLSSAAASSSQRAWIILPEDNQGRAFMVFDNFRTIMRWNRSYYFALSVGMLADAIAKPLPAQPGAS